MSRETYSIFRTSLHPSIYSSTTVVSRVPDSSSGGVNSTKIATGQINIYSNNLSQNYFTQKINESSNKPKIQIIQSPLYKPISKPTILLKSRQIFPEKKGNHVTFNHSSNRIIFINGKDFYKNNNTKHTIWWSPQELSMIRNRFIYELNDIQRANPKLSVRECIMELVLHHS